MQFYISVETRDDAPKTFYWNRRKAMWQTYLTKSCAYPTYKGSWRVFKNKAHLYWPYIDGRPVRAVLHKPL